MARIRGSIKKATKPVKEHSSFATVVRESESSMPTKKKEPLIFLTKATKDQFHDNILKRHFHLEQGILLLQQRDLGKQVYKIIFKLKWETFNTHPRSYSPSLVREFYANLCDHESELLPSTHNTTINLDKMCLIHSIVKGRKIDVGAILHYEIADCVTWRTGILVFPLFVMLLCQQNGIMPCDDEEILDNQGSINEASIEITTHSKDTLTMKGAETNKKRKGKTKDIELSNFVNNKHIRLVATIEDMDRSQNLFYAYTMANNKCIEDNLRDQDRSVESPPIMHDSDDEKEEGSWDIEEYMRRIDSLAKGDFIIGQEVTVVEEEVDVGEEEARVVVVNEKVKEENTKKKAAEKQTTENIINASEIVGATTDNLE
ncbi:hypothetical protein J1N35_007602 [Gossypium stocksii]|uniref:Uncharacterized protein n=1 Tax=Gossypium stocksii TaxID=47602 RepID=A0A9D4AFE5_9ROSI|nr:hypothetical protein J1N35_007602 [Gossypium stocksii]